MANLKNNDLIPHVKSYQTGLKITNDQNNCLQTWVSATHYAYNLFLNVQYGLITAYHKQYPEYKIRKKLPQKIKKQYFISAFEFEKIFNHDIKLSKTFENSWMLNIPSHSFRYGFKTAYQAFLKYFKGQGGKPHFKGYHARRSIYFDHIVINKNKVKLPKIGWLQLQRFGYLPTTKKLLNHNYHVTGVWLHEDCGHWFISVQTNEVQQRHYLTLKQDLVLGIDLGIKDFAILSDHTKYVNITKGRYYRHLINYLKRIQRKLSRQQMPKVPGQRRIITMNYRKTRLRLKRWYRKIRCYMDNYIQQRTSDIIKKRPSTIVFEDLNIQGMKSNHKLAPALQKLPLYKFKQLLIWKAKKAGIEIRQVSRWYPSTKTCSRCGLYNRKQFKGIFNDLKIRTFKCPYCGLVIDRDLNAAINLQNRQHYTILTNREMDVNNTVVTTI